MWQFKSKYMWFIHFAFFRVHHYYFHTYNLTIIVQSRFSFCSQLKIRCFYDKFNFKLQIIINIFRSMKMKTKILGSLITIIFSSIIIMTWLNYCKFFWWKYCANTEGIQYLPDFIFYFVWIISSFYLFW